MTRKYGNRADNICAAWVPHDRTTKGIWRIDMKPRHVCHRLYHPHDDRHLTADGQWFWRTGDPLAQPANHPPRKPPQIRHATQTP